MKKKLHPGRRFSPRTRATRREVSERPLPAAAELIFLSPESTLPDFERETAAFERMLPEMLATKERRFVAILDGQIIDEDEDQFALAFRMERDYRDKFVLIRQVLPGEEPVDHLSSPEWESP